MGKRSIQEKVLLGKTKYENMVFNQPDAIDGKPITHTERMIIYFWAGITIVVIIGAIYGLYLGLSYLMTLV